MFNRAIFLIAFSGGISLCEEFSGVFFDEREDKAAYKVRAKKSTKKIRKISRDFDAFDKMVI